MPKVPDISGLVEILISSTYPELQESLVSVSWGKTASYAQIQWDELKKDIRIRVNKDVKTWHEAGITGLLSHELSHPAQQGDGMRELKTDSDAILRGLGPYLAVERLLAGKYEDHVLKRGKDRYLGYRTIRTQLTHNESRQLDALLAEIGLVPSKPHSSVTLNHDVVLFKKDQRTTLTIEGFQFLLPEGMHDPDIKLVERNYVTYVYADDILIGEYIEEEE